MNPGDRVIYAKDPVLYGEMEVGHVKEGGVLCIIDPDGRRPDVQRFDEAELEPATVTQAGLPTRRAA